jgi:alpha-L-rhamnosidase
VAPLALDIVPDFTWQVESERRGLLLPYGQVQLLQDGDVVWDSGKVPTPVPRIEYGGPGLHSKTRYHWRVRVWSQSDEPSDWSAEAVFDTGLLGDGLGEARWIRLDEETPVGDTAPVQYLRAEFHLDTAVRRARVYSTALGWYRLYLNGTDATGPGFYPGFTAFESRVDYQVRDATNLLAIGDNAVGIVLADGRFRGRLSVEGCHAVYGNRTAAIARIEIELVDGREFVVATNGGWEGGHGEIVVSDPREGEVIDARLSGEWSVRGGSLPEPVDVIEVDESRTLEASAAQPLRMMEPLPVVDSWKLPSGALVLDFGQNMHGVTRLTLRGPSGRAVSVRHSEVLLPDRDLDLDYLIAGTPFTLYLGPDTLILSGGSDVFEPTFCTQGYRYVSVDVGEDVEVVEALSLPVQADLAYTGRFESSHPLINRFHDNVVWGMRGNFLDVPTDCPTRERSAWTGDAQVFSRTALVLADAAAYLSNWLVDARLQQHSDGVVNDVVPLDADDLREGATPSELAPGLPNQPPGSAGWGDAIVLIPWDIYQATGSTRPLVENYDAMVKWVERYARMAAEHRDPTRLGSPEAHERFLVDTGFHYGEWFEPDGEGDGCLTTMELLADLIAHPRSSVATAYFAHSSHVLAEIARLLGRAADATHFEGYAQGARHAWQREFMKDPLLLQPDAQATYVRALEFDLVTSGRRAQTAQRLVDRIRDRGNHLGTGFLSTSFLLEQLTKSGYGDVALDLLLQESVPSWLGQVVRGATTVWESWAGYDEQGKAVLSHNHYSLGASARWLYESLAGIRAASPGWRNITVDPLINTRIPRVAAAVGTPFGEVSVAWELANGEVTLDVRIPPGATARVRLDGASPDTATQDDAPISNVTADNRGLYVRIGSGRYWFSWARHRDAGC